MSQTWPIEFNVDIGGIATDLDATPTLSSRDAAYGVKNTSTDVVIVNDATSMTRLSAGRYSYTITVDAEANPDHADYLTQYTYSVEWVLDGVTHYTVIAHTTDPEETAGATSITPLYADLVTEIQDAFPDITSATKLARIIKNGYTMFLYPPEVIVNGRPVSGYKWTWASPLAVLNTIEEYDTGTVTVIEDDATVTLAGGTWPSWAEDATIIITDDAGDDYTFTVTERTDGADIELSSAWAGVSDDTLAYEIHYHPDYYELPAAFGGLVGGLVLISTESPTTSFPPLIVRPSDVVSQYAIADQNPSSPRYVSIVPTDFVGATGQRYEMLLWPEPDLNYAICYRYNVNLDAMVAGEYHAGGPSSAQTVKQCCLAAAELLESGGATGTYYKLAMQALATGIAHDMTMRPANLGQSQENSDVVYRYDRLADGVLYNGVDITI